MKAADVAFCSNVCREAAKVICAETHLPFDLYRDLSKAHGILAAALEQVKERVPVEKEPA